MSSELTLDWRRFQDVLKSKPVPPLAPGKIFSIVDRDTVLAAYGSGEDLDTWIGLTLGELKAAFPKFQVQTLEWSALETGLMGSMDQGRFLEQIQFLQRETMPKRELKERLDQHFVTELVQGIWRRVLPHSFGLLLGIESEDGRVRHTVLVTRTGKITAFFPTDFASLGAERELIQGARTKSISERLVVPMQGVFVKESVWNSWIQSEYPWRAVLLSWFRREVSLAPLRPWLVPFLCVRALFR